MTQPPTILIGVSKKKINRLLHSKNEIYYYVINDTIRKVLATLFDALGNISSRNDYYSFIKKYVQFKPFSTCKSAVSLRHTLSIKQAMVIAIDNITRELYLPSQHEFDSISLHVNYPTLIPQHKNDFIKEIVEEHYTKQYKDQLKHVLTELQHKSSMKPVLNEIIEKSRKKQCRDQLQKVLNILVHKSSMKLVLNEIKKVNTPKVELEIEVEDYEDDFEVEFEEKENNEYEYTLIEEPTLETIQEELDDSLESVVDELKEVMSLAKNCLPNAKPVCYPPTIEIDDEEDENFAVQKVAFPSPSPQEEKPLEKSLPSTVEFIEVKEEEKLEAVEEQVESIEHILKEVEEAIDHSLPEEEKHKLEEETLKNNAEENLENDIEEISKEEFEQEKEPLKSSTLVNELFQKYQKDTKAEENVKKPEPPKSYLSSMWSYLGWKSK